MSCCPHPVERHAYNGCAECGCGVRWDEHPDRALDASPAGIVANEIRLRDEIANRLSFCSLDELRVLDVLLGRLELGRERYGHLDLTKPRDWNREEAEEYADAAIYRACGVLAKGPR